VEVAAVVVAQVAALAWAAHAIDAQQFASTLLVVHLSVWPAGQVGGVSSHCSPP